VAAEGVPKDLMRDIDAAVLEVTCDHPRAAQHVLNQVGEVRSVTQLGARLHILVDPATPEPERLVRTRLDAADLRASVEATDASLEDVFVAATRRPLETAS